MCVFNYFKNIFIAVDQLVNAILFGSPDETLGARFYRLEQTNHLIGKLVRPILDFIFFWDKNHCKILFEKEVLNEQLPKDYDV